MTKEELLAETLDSAYALALQLTGNPSDAWDLTHDAMVRAIQGLPNFRRDSHPKTWVYRVVINTWKNQTTSPWKRWWSKLVSLDAPNHEDRRKIDPPSTEPTPDEEFENLAVLAEFNAALNALAPEERAALLLRELDGKSYAEIGSVLGVPIGTVKSKLHRARALLGKILKRTR